MNNQKTVLITGASAGIGRALAREFASHGYNLVLAARRKERLEVLQGSLTSDYHVRVDIYPVDLLQEDAPDRIMDFADREGISVDILINNAGMGYAGLFADMDWNSIKSILDLNIIATTRMTYLFLRRMEEKNHGTIVNIASTLAFAPTAGEDVYAASKAYILSFTQALYEETKHTGVSVLTICPGMTRTEFFDQAGYSLNNFNLAIPEQFAAFAYKKIIEKKPLSIHRLFNQAVALFARLSTRVTARRAFAAACRTDSKD